MALPNRAVIVVLGTLLLFLLVNFNHPLASSYSLIFIFTIILIFLDPKADISIDLSRENLLRDLGIGIAGYALFLGIAFAVVSLLQAVASSLGLFGIIGMMSEIQPVFAGNKILTIVTFGGLVPVIENTFFFGVLQEFFSDKFRVPLTLKSLRAHALFAVVGFLFMVFHLTSKGLPTSAGQLLNEPALVVTFIFGYVMAALVAFSKESMGGRDLRPSIFAHQIANVAAILKKMAVI